MDPEQISPATAEMANEQEVEQRRVALQHLEAIASQVAKQNGCSISVEGHAPHGEGHYAPGFIAQDALMLRVVETDGKQRDLGIIVAALDSKTGDFNFSFLPTRDPKDPEGLPFMNNMKIASEDDKTDKIKQAIERMKGIQDAIERHTEYHRAKGQAV